MKTENLTLLRERYPKIFERLAWGVNCGDGWFDLIDTLCGNLDHCAKHGGMQVVALEIKEKFGGLRFYQDGCNDQQVGMIRMAAAMSWHICDICGNRGQLTGEDWVRTRCDKHANTR